MAVPFSVIATKQEKLQVLGQKNTFVCLQMPLYQ
jgi:hypothetical protein